MKFNTTKFTIAIANNRREKLWKNIDITWEEFLKKVSTTTRTGETVAEYKALPKAKQDEIKDVGGFVAGRLRLVIPLSRNVSPDEYMAVARKVAQDIGIEQFDDTTYEPTRLMYWPSTSKGMMEIRRGIFGFRSMECREVM
jgi:putative DNA primase/helicase